MPGTLPGITTTTSNESTRTTASASDPSADANATGRRQWCSRVCVRSTRFGTCLGAHVATSARKAAITSLSHPTKSLISWGPRVSAGSRFTLPLRTARGRILFSVHCRTPPVHHFGALHRRELPAHYDQRFRDPRRHRAARDPQGVGHLFP